MAKSMEKRNAEIVRMSRNGIAHAEIAQNFRLSRASIDMIVRNAEKDREMDVKNAGLLGRIRAADDLDMLWSISGLIDILAPLTMTKMALQRYRADTPEISLRTLMEMAISEVDDPRPGYLITPLLDLRLVGEKGFWSVINRLSELDFGQCGKSGVGTASMPPDPCVANQWGNPIFMVETG